MDDRILTLERDAGVILRRDLLSLGYSAKTLQQLLRSKELHRVRHGAYATADRWKDANEVVRHRILSIAVARNLGDNAALSHLSSLIHHEIDIWGANLNRVHVTRLDGGAGRLERDVHHHVGECEASDLVKIDEMLCTAPARAVVESLTLQSVQSGLVSADHALHRKLVTPGELAETYQQMSGWPNMRRAQLVLRLADGRIESVGESRARYVFWAQGLPMPDLQHEIWDGGRLVGRTDFAWPEYGLLGEFDGMEKYLRSYRPGETPSEVVLREKRREDEIRELTGMIVVRIVWADLARPIATARRVRRLLQMRRA